jgi:flagellin
MTTITNIDSLHALMGLNQANKTISQASQRLSTGFRVNSAADDVAGLAVANDLKTQIGSFNAVLTNIAQGSAAASTVDSVLTEVVDILGYIREAAVSAESSTVTSTEAAAYQDVIDAYVTAIDTLFTNATFNGTSLMSSTATSLDIQTGVSSGDSTTITFDAISTTLLGIASLDVSTSTTTAATAVDSIDDALDTVNTYQTYIGAMSNVMDSQYTVANDTVTNFSAAYGNIMNADYAAETAKLAAAQIQRDGAAAMMLQSNDLDRSLVDYLLNSLSN